MRWEKTDGPKGIRKTNGLTITIKSRKKKKVPVERSLGATGRETCVARLLEEYMKGRVRVPAGQESLFITKPIVAI